MRTSLTVPNTRRMVWEVLEHRVTHPLCLAPQFTQGTPLSRWVCTMIRRGMPTVTMVLAPALVLAAIVAPVATAVVTVTVMVLLPVALVALPTMETTEVVREAVLVISLGLIKEAITAVVGEVITEVVREMATELVREVATEILMNVIREAAMEVARETATAVVTVDTGEVSNDYTDFSSREITMM